MIKNATVVTDNAQRTPQTLERGDPAYVMSRSELKDFQRNPWDWRFAWKQYADKMEKRTGERPEKEDTEATFWGSGVDVLTLTPEQFNSRYLVTPPTYPSTGMECPVCKTVTSAKTCREHKVARVPVTTEKAWKSNASYCQKWEEENGEEGKITVRSALVDQWKVAAEILLEHEIAGPLLSGARKQVLITAEYHDRATKLVIPISMILDAVPESLCRECGGHGAVSCKSCNGTGQSGGTSIVDLKTSNSSARWENEIEKWYLDGQAWLYLLGWNQATGEERTEMIHVIQKSEPPYTVDVVIPDQAFLTIGKVKILNALMEYCQCLKTGKWRSQPIGAEIAGNMRIVRPQAWMLEKAMLTTPTIAEEPREEMPSDDVPS